MVDEKIYAYSVGLTNQPPAFAEATTVRTVAENAAAGIDIGDPMEATDPGDSLTYRLGGADESSFDIDSGTGQLMTEVSLDHETRASYAVVVTAADPSGLSDSIDVAVTVTDVDDLLTLVARYDADSSGTIELSELATAIDEYLFGMGPNVPSLADIARLIDLYLFS